MTGDIFPGDVVHVPRREGLSSFAIFVEPWNAEPGPLGGHMVGRLRPDSMMFVIARVRHQYHLKAGRDYLYVWTMRGHLEGSKFGWIPIDHVSKVNEFEALGH